MKKVLLLCVAAAFLATPTWAHDGLEFNSFLWPDNALPTMDGDISEWGIVPDGPYVITTDITYDVIYSYEIEKDDLDIRFKTGYNPNNDLFYVAGWVFDDYHETDDGLRDDTVELHIDGNHDGSPHIEDWGKGDGVDDDTKVLAKNYGYQWWGIIVPPVPDSPSTAFGADGVVGENKNPWAAVPPHMNIHYSFEGEEFGESTYFYEISLSAWDVLIWNEDLDSATKSDLETGGTVGFSMVFADFDGPLGDNPPVVDGPNNTYDGFWATGGFDGGNDTSDFFLAPLEADVFTAVEEETWGRLKTRFH
jgi:hypothetical protein